MPTPINLVVPAGGNASSGFVIPGGRPFCVFVPSCAPTNLFVDFGTSSGGSTYYTYLPAHDAPCLVASASPTKFPASLIVPPVSRFARIRLGITPTDVLSFPLSEPHSKKLAGELVIGAEVALEQATQRGHDVQAEIALYVIHGLLHLCGFDDKSERAAAAMRKRERHYLALLGLPDIAGE